MSRRLKNVLAGVAGGHDSGSIAFTGSVSGRTGGSAAAAVRRRWFGDNPVAFGLGFLLSAASMAFLVYAIETSGERPVPTLALPKFTTDGTSKVVHRQHGALPRERSAGQASAGSATSNERHPEIGGRGLEDVALGISGEVKKDLPDYAIRKAFVGFAVVEGPSGTQDVIPGVELPGAGRVVAIKQVGPVWIVETTEGIIQGSTR